VYSDHRAAAKSIKGTDLELVCLIFYKKRINDEKGAPCYKPLGKDPRRPPALNVHFRIDP